VILKVLVERKSPCATVSSDFSSFFLFDVFCLLIFFFSFPLNVSVPKPKVPPTENNRGTFEYVDSSSVS
jgi:hypothetical protein